MDDNKSFIKLHRKLLKWEWYNDNNTKILFIHLLLIANWEDKNWEGILLKRGQVVTGRKKLSKELGLTEQQIRTSLNKLKSTNEITTTPTNKYTIITINNYNLYQTNHQQGNQQVTNNQPTNNQQITTTKEYKEYKEYKEMYVFIYSLVERAYGRTLNSVEKEMIDSWVNKEYDFKLIEEAIKISLLKHNIYLNYPNGILQNWEDKGYKTLDDVYKNERKNEEKNKKPKVEVFDYDWLNEEEEK